MIDDIKQKLVDLIELDEELIKELELLIMMRVLFCIII